jgi:hypothetical protein
MNNSEVRLFYKARIDWDTVYFSSSCSTDLGNKAAAIAKERHADHYNYGLATSQEEHQLVNDARLARRVMAAASMKDQVELIEKATGKGDR